MSLRLLPQMAVCLPAPNGIRTFAPRWKFYWRHFKLFKCSSVQVWLCSSADCLMLHVAGLLCQPQSLPSPTTRPHHNTNRCAVCRELYLLQLMVLSLPLRQRCRPIDCAASSVSRTNYVAAIGGERLCHRCQSSRIFNCFGKKKKNIILENFSH